MGPQKKNSEKDEGAAGRAKLTSMATNIKNGIIFSRFRVNVGQFNSILPQGLLVVQEADSGLILFKKFHRILIQWRLAALR